jgi:uncharacterized peroxidase-related enzyme
VAYIRHIPPARAGGRLAQIYREIRSEVPRVPNLMQVFSLRPDTMEGVYHSWLSMMWTGTVPRRTKELVAVAVSKAACSAYCVDAHMIFLLAAGMPPEDGYAVADCLADADCLEDRERELVRFATKLTSEPRAVTQADRLLFAKAWPDVEERVELLATIAAFNSVARVANALGVSHEIPALVRQFEPGRRGAIAMMSRLTSLSIDLQAKSVVVQPPEYNRDALAELFGARLGFGSAAPGFELLEHCPEIFDGQVRTMRSAVAVIPRDRWMRIGLVVGRLVGSDYFASHCAEWLAQRSESAGDVIAASEGADVALADVEIASLRFARDFTLHSWTIGEDRIRELRGYGLSDGAILDLAFVAGVLNGMARLAIALAPV